MGSGIEMEETGTARTDKAGTGPIQAWKRHAAKHHDGGLLAIGLFKLVEAAFFLLVGLGALHFVHRDLEDSALRLAMRLRMDPEGRLVGFLLDHLDSITARRLREIGVATFF